jgi:hypothetical protein
MFSNFTGFNDKSPRCMCIYYICVYVYVLSQDYVWSDGFSYFDIQSEQTAHLLLACPVFSCVYTKLSQCTLAAFYLNPSSFCSSSPESSLLFPRCLLFQSRASWKNADWMLLPEAITIISDGSWQTNAYTLLPQCSVGQFFYPVPQTLLSGIQPDIVSCFSQQHLLCFLFL